MSFKKNVHKQLGLQPEKVTGSFIEDAPSVGGLRCVRGVPFVEPIEARKKISMTLSDAYFESMMYDAQTLEVRNESGSSLMVFELRMIKKGLKKGSEIGFGPCSDSERKCRVCGCTEDHACAGGCSWVEEDLCSACAKPAKKKAKAKRRKP